MLRGRVGMSRVFENEGGQWLLFELNKQRGVRWAAQRASSLAEDLVGRYGMSSTVGPRVLLDMEQSAFLGNGASARKAHGEPLDVRAT